MKRINILMLSFLLCFMAGTYVIYGSNDGKGSTCKYSCTVSSDEEVNKKKCVARSDGKGDDCIWGQAGAACSGVSSTGCNETS